ncbi:AAA family ATPase [Nocardia cyriacigeorgica]|uniref:ATP-dependent nuclease n=1 Tax=Nocardia cyriacigeorgica TaxID=135487 RepID=UPI001894BE32|nr:AAA family ATPase [Nocardia cyriacigeorgica]MBF6097829.1 AAA family ATPase [Nocardia cyriacigeorgica]
MIERLIIENFRKFRRLEIEPRPGLNILVGDNDAGKSTVLEAINLALTGRINGRWAADEKNPFWFNQHAVDEFFTKYGTADSVQAPEILIELYFSADTADPDLHRMRGVHNSRSERGARTDCPGVRLHIVPSDDYKAEFNEYMKNPPAGILPAEYYDCRWTDFDGKILSRRPKALGSAFIDSRTLRSSAGLDFHTRQILDSFMDEKDRVGVAIEHRRSRHSLTTGILAQVSQKMTADGHELKDDQLSLAMDQSARAAWETDVIPQIANIPFAMSGQGQQSSVKVSLAMHRSADRAKYILIEEPETHQSHTSLRSLLDRIEKLAGDKQQLFVSTHSSYVLNRLGLDSLLLLRGQFPVHFKMLNSDTVKYFQHLSGYDTLRLVLSRRVVLVEGPSDEIIFKRCFLDETGSSTDEKMIDVISMGGITFKRALELCSLLDREVIALQDNDGSTPEEIRSEPELASLLSSKRHMCIGDPTKGETLEPQLIHFNGIEKMRQVLNLRKQDNPITWMPNHKTETALRISLSSEKIVFPDYIREAVHLLQ